MRPDWQKILIGPDASILKALDAINEPQKIALVVDGERRLLGTVTDGDVRRGLLAGCALADPVSKIMHIGPTAVKEGLSPQQMLALMRGKDYRQLPLVNARGEVVGIETMTGLMAQERREEDVVLMAGGYGRRLKERTRDTPKPLLAIGGKPILETILENFIEYGFRRFTISLGYLGDKVEDYFGDGTKWGVSIRYVREEEPLGTGGALALLNPKPERTFIVMNGDVLTKLNLQQLLDYHHEHGAMATMCVRGFSSQIPYGVVRTEGVEIAGFEEKPVQNVMVNAGIYVLEPEALALIPPRTRYDMPSLFEGLRQRRCKAVAFPIHEYWIDVGNPHDFVQADAQYAEMFGT